MKLNKQIAKTLACHQIHALIRKGEQVEMLKAEWKRRWALEHPFEKHADGIRECPDYR